ncbi:MAG: phosphoenolpyruvate--protein phosphotransferase [Candidatus Hydrogenedentes bacterium]|nr:phosphoenolpyruvate--protein phosphotransferase [Candidatus Hydrogenedentota bacterium]
MEIALKGIGVSPGIAIGPALPFRVHSLDVPKYPVRDRSAELERFNRARDEVRQDLQRLHQQTASKIGDEHADIFKSHLMIVDDIKLREDVESRLETESYNVEYLLDDIITQHTKMMESVDDSRFRERAMDFVDVGTSILSKLLNTDLRSLEHLERPSIVIAHDLAPSDTAKMDVEHALGLATDASGPTSHTAILARALEIPAVVGLKHVGAHALPGDTVIVDGNEGYVYIRPNAETVARFREEKRRLEEESRALLLVEHDRPSATLDGHPVPLLANIELPLEISHGVKVKAQGVGLYRTEYLFLNHTSLPTEEEQFRAYAQVAEAMRPAPVVIRTLDLGGDKLVAHLRLDEETNPQLGWRAIRFCLERPDIFKAQLRAIFRASVHGNVQIMFPLISGLDELRQVKNVVKEVCEDLVRRGVSFDKNVKLGSMIEVPSAVSLADVLAKECDFFSIGTNDLIQYSLAVDRGNEKIAHMYQPGHPAVLRMIQLTVRAAKAARIPCGICGEMAGMPMFTELLLGLGVDSLSMSAVAIPLVRAEVSGTRLTEAKRLARRALKLSTVSEVTAFLSKRYKERRALARYLGQSGTARPAGNHRPSPVKPRKTPRK